MKKLLIFVLISAIFITIFGLTTRKSNMPPASRGKVIADTKSSIFDMNLNKASILSISNSDVAEDIEGRVCILNQNDEPTGKYYKMVPRSFPNWFEFGCEDGNIVEYKIISRGPNDDWAQVIKLKRQK